MNYEQNKIRRYIRLDQLLRDSEGYTLKEILLDEQIDEISERLLRDNLNEFKEVFGAIFVDSLYRGKERLWKYKDSSFSIFSQVNNDVEIIKKAIDNLNAFKGDPRYDWLRLFLIGLEHGIHSSTALLSFDTNLEYVGLDNIESLSLAIINKYPVKLTYQPFGKEEFQVNFHPYHLRQYNGRWFVFGLNEDWEGIMNYALDRIISIEHLSKPYVSTDIDFDVFFEDIVGVTNVAKNEVEKVLLKVDKKSIDYIRTKPLHWSQRELKDRETENEVIIQLKVKVNTELKMLLFSYSDAIEVLEPPFLRKTFSKRVENMYKKYNP